MWKSEWFYTGVVAGIILLVILMLPSCLIAQEEIVPTIPCVFHHSQGQSTTIIQGGHGTMYKEEFHCFKSTVRRM